MKNVQRAAHRLRLAAIVVACLSVPLPLPVLAGDLEPMGPPAPTMRTLESLGFDCPNDPPNTTNLLFTLLTNQGGFDSGFSISNTGADPFGTTGQTAKCTLNFYGANAPAPVTTPNNIAPGDTYANTAATVAPGFQGYMIATCNFAYAHGFAFVGDIGFSKLAMGYLAQVVCANRGSNSMGAGK